MTVSVNYKSMLTATEQLADAYLSSNAKSVVHNGLDVSQNFNGGTSVPVAKIATFALTLSEGAAQIDLRTLPGTNGGAIDGNGLKVQFAKFRNNDENANDITIEPAAEDGYDLLGAGFAVTLKPGQEMLLALDEQAGDIGTSARYLDVTGTAAQVLECEIIMG